MQSPNLLIIEVLKTCKRINNFLGAHAWCEFLKRPTSSDLDRLSKVYYCKFMSDRDVQKHGEYWCLRSGLMFRVNRS